MTELITPAKEHDNKYPKPKPNYSTPNQVPPVTNPLPVATAMPILHKALVFGDEPVRQAPAGDLIRVLGDGNTLAKIVITKENFHPQTGLCTIQLSPISEDKVIGVLFSNVSDGSNAYLLTAFRAHPRDNIIVLALAENGGTYTGIIMSHYVSE